MVNRGLRVLYSFPHRLGRPGIGTTAWHQAVGVARAGGRVELYCGSCERSVPGVAAVYETMEVAGIPLPYRAMGLDRAMSWHDWRVARALTRRPAAFDIVHCWPSGALRTLAAARMLGVPSVLERPSSHTAHVYEVAGRECERLGLTLHERHYGAANPRRLAREEAEYELAQALLCPSAFAASTFAKRGYDASRLKLHQYGYDPEVFYAPQRNGQMRRPLNAVYVGECFPLKGLHLALRAWLGSSAARNGRFRICGRFMPHYRNVLSSELSDPSIEMVGFVSDVASIMRQSDVLVLPSLSEGSALVTYEGRACGLVLMVSDAAGAKCSHMQDSVVHPAGNVDVLRQQFDMLVQNPELLLRLRRASIMGLPELTWDRAAARLMEIYCDVIGTGGAQPDTSA